MSRIRIVGSVAGVVALAALAAPPAGGAGPGLPRTYDVQRVDSPDPAPSSNFAGLLVNGGDINRDGKDDLLVSQGAALLSDGAGALDGELVVVSGADGSVIRANRAPEPDPPGPGDRRAAFGTYVGKLADIGRCPATPEDANADRICDAGNIGAPDGVPEILASAVNLDVPTPGAPGGVAEDIGRVYVIDGATGVLLKRIDMPEADRLDQDPRTERLGSSPAGPVRPLFGRTVLSPAGLPPCAGEAGVGACPPDSGPGSVPAAVKTGDLDGGGRPDIVVGASFFYDTDQTNPDCNRTPTSPLGDDICQRSGRLYMYRGEDIAGTNPAAILSTPSWTVKNPLAQDDPASTTVITEPELFGHAVAPVGDVGTCNAPSVQPGRPCPAAQVDQTPDGKPDVLVSIPRLDGSGFDSGGALLLDGATGARLHTYAHPEAETGALFGFSITNQPVAGDLGASPLPDVHLPALGQNIQFRGQGRGYVLNGNRTTVDAVTLATLNDPTPQASGGFGASSAGVGDLAGDAHNELLVGALSSFSPDQNPDTVSDVHIFDPLTERVLQTIPDPDQQKVSNFGSSLAPLGDLNGDGFLDLAAGAGRFDASEAQQDAGRLYIFRSNNTPPPPPPSPTEEAPPEEFSGEEFFGDEFFGEEFFSDFESGVTLTERRVSLRTTKSRVSRSRKGKRRTPRVQLRGSISAPENEEECEPSQRLQLERRRTGGPRRLRVYKVFQRLRTSTRSGTFKSKEFRPTRTYSYRAVVPESEQCQAAISKTVKITVRDSQRSQRRSGKRRRS